MMALTQDIFNRMGKAAKTAFDRVTPMTGEETDPDLKLYKSLQPDDFNKIVQQYGAENTLRYIQKMESRGMIGRKNA